MDCCGHHHDDAHQFTHIPWDDMVAIHTYKIDTSRQRLTYITIDFTQGEYFEFVDDSDDFDVVIELIEYHYPQLAGLKARIAQINHTSVVDLYQSKDA